MLGVAAVCFLHRGTWKSPKCHTLILGYTWFFFKSKMSDYTRKIALSVYIYQYFLGSLSFMNNKYIILHCDLLIWMQYCYLDADLSGLSSLPSLSLFPFS